MTLIGCVGDAHHPGYNAWVSSFFNSNNNTNLSDATSGNSASVPLVDQFDNYITSMKNASVKGQEYVSGAVDKVSEHVKENKEGYKIGAVAALSVATLIGVAYCKSVGFTKNYGVQKSRVIEKALRLLPVDRLKNIIHKSTLPPHLTNRQKNGLAMTRNYLWCVESSLDVSDKGNARRRQIILRFEAQLDEIIEKVDYDTTGASNATSDLQKYGLDRDMTDEEIDDYFYEGKDRIDHSTPKTTPRQAYKTGVLKIGTLEYVIPKSCQDFASQSKEEFRKALAEALHVNRVKMGTKKLSSTVAREVDAHLISNLPPRFGVEVEEEDYTYPHTYLYS